MKRSLLFLSLGVVIGVTASFIAPVPAQPRDGAGKENDNQKEILGFWTEIYLERAAETYTSYSSIDDARLRFEWVIGATFPGFYSPGLMRFLKDKAEAGPNRKDLFPARQFDYRLDVDGKNGAIDFDSSDKKNPGTARGIYLLKDDLLIIAMNVEYGDARPERFTSSKKPRRILQILRRGKVEPSGDWAGRQFRLPD